MPTFQTFSGIPTMPRGAAQMPNKDSIINDVEQNNEYMGIQSDHVDIPDRLKMHMEKREKATIKALKKIVKKATKKAVKKAIKKDEEKKQEADEYSKKTNTVSETTKTFFNKIGDVIIKALPTLLVTIVSIAAKAFFGGHRWFSHRRKGVIA